MWTPPQRIKYRANRGSTPTQEEIASSQWLSPIRLGNVELRERSWIPAMVPWRATEEGKVTDDVLDWYERFAQGQPGAIVVEATGIRDIKSGPLLRISDDRFLPGLEKLVEVVREASEGRTRLFIQLIDFLTVRRRPEPSKYFNKYIYITDKHRENIPKHIGSDDIIVREYLADLSEEELSKVLNQRELRALKFGYREEISDMHLPHIVELPRVLPDLFASAAERAQKAGFDGVELHYAHAYTMASFLSARNTRSDEYGGSRENRVRLPLEVYDAVRAQVGADYCVGSRLLSEECIDGGSTLEDAQYFSLKLAEAGMDFLSYSRGGKFDDAKQPKVGGAVYPYTGRSGYECMPGYISDEFGPFGRNVEPVTRIKQAINAAGYSTPVVVAGGIHSFQQAEQILQNEQADIVASARQSLADPDWILKIKQGKATDVKVCEYTNYCEGLDQKHKQVTCQLWDRSELDAPDAKLTKDGRRRMTAPRWRA